MTNFYQIKAVDEFKLIRRRAGWSKLYSIFRRKANCLPKFDDLHLSPQAKQHQSIREIPLEKIVGSVGRGDDFDANFRPLKDHLSDRWIGVYVLANTSGWDAIKVYQVNDVYYVVDGHHRVSVARYLGHKYVDAEVWTFRRPVKQALSHLTATDALAAVCGNPCSV